MHKPCHSAFSLLLLLLYAQAFLAQHRVGAFSHERSMSALPLGDDTDLENSLPLGEDKDLENLLPIDKSMDSALERTFDSAEQAAIQD